MCNGAYYPGLETFVLGKSGCTLIMEEIVDKCITGAAFLRWSARSNDVEMLPNFSYDG